MYSRSREESTIQWILHTSFLYQKQQVILQYQLDLDLLYVTFCKLIPLSDVHAKQLDICSIS